VVVATSPQLLCAVAGHLIAKRFGAPLVMEVRDLWPESLVAVGASRHSAPLVTLLERLACQMYRRASHVVTITEAQRAAIVAEGVSETRVSVIPNGVDAAFFEEAAGRRTDGKFVVTYIGTLGMAHRLETLLDAAHLLRDDASVEFRIVGEGARREALEARAKELRLTNVTFAGERPRGEVPRWIAESDACAVLLRRNEVFLTVVPSKMLEIMAAGRPIILGVEGEALALLERARAGIGIAPESAEQLAAAIRQLRDDATLAAQLGENGRAFVRREFRREDLAARYLELLERVSGTVVGGEKECLKVGKLEGSKVETSHRS
jgi:glycosyltransferase involved in cell wall biosynthesis